MFTKVAIHSAPRSGSSWLGQIFNSHPDVAYRFQPLFSFAFKGRLTTSSTLDEINQFYKELKETTDSFVLQNDEGRLSKKTLFFAKSAKPTHVVYKEVRYHQILENLLRKDPEIIGVGLVRNPMAVMNSWLKSPKEFRTDLGWDVMDQWRTGAEKNLDRIEEYHGFDKWKESTMQFLELRKAYPKNFYLIKYNDLLDDAVPHVSDLFSFCGLDMAESTLRFIKESRSQNDGDVYGVYKSHTVDDDWKRLLDPRISEEIEKELRNTELEQFIK